MKVLYSGYLSAATGMSEAARNRITALYLAGKDYLQVATEDVPNVKARVDLGSTWDISKSLNEKSSDHDVKIIHTTPDLITHHLDPMKFHIMECFWETDRLPRWWAWCMNLCDEIWTGDEYHAEVFRKSGVKKNIWVQPQPIDTSTTSAPPFTIKQHQGFLFYSIFQWIERKNPKALLHAYWKEFSGNDKVGLLLKTYKEMFTMEECMAIKREIEDWKKDLLLPHYPKVYLYPYSLDKRNMARIHCTGDCFVSAHRGEGWGIPIAEAMLYGKPVISTAYGGINEYLTTETAFPIRWKYEQVHGMDFVPWYDSSQRWAVVDEDKLREAMRFVFDNRDKAQDVGKRGQKWVLENLNMLRIGNSMVDRLKAIERDILKNQI